MNYASEILEIVNQSRSHPTAEQIYLSMKEKGSKAVLATVYNNLARLNDQGSVRRISVEGYPDRYDRIKRHDHLVCRECGMLSDITFSDLTAQLQAQTKEQIIDYDLRVSYICPACRKKQEENN